MNSPDNPSEEIILCCRCAWREVCVKRFSFDNTRSIKCPDFSLDIELIKGEKKGVQKKDQGNS